MDVIKELKFLGKFTQKNRRGVGLGGGGGSVGVVRVDVNEELKFLRKFKKKIGGGSGGRVGGSGWM